MITSTKNAPTLIMDIFKAGLTPMLHGSPGTAKSSIIHQIAKSKNLKLIDLRLSQSDPTDLNGFPFLNKESGKAGYVPMDTFPIEGDPLPEGCKGWVLLLDEFNSAPMSVQAAAYKIVLDRQVGQHNLHPQVYCIAAGNLASDKAIVNRLSTAMQSRLIHLEIELDPKDWVLWAEVNNLDYRVTNYIESKPDILHKLDPDSDDFTFPCARTWEFVSKLIRPWPMKIEYEKTALLAGAVGEGAAREFMAYCEIYEDLPTITDIINNPENIKISDEPSIIFAMSNMIAGYVDEKNFPTLMKCIMRLPPEFQVTCLQASHRRCAAIGSNPTWKKWIVSNAQELM